MYGPHLGELHLLLYGCVHDVFRVLNDDVFHSLLFRKMRVRTSSTLKCPVLRQIFASPSTARTMGMRPIVSP